MPGGGRLRRFVGRAASFVALVAIVVLLAAGVGGKTETASAQLPATINMMDNSFYPAGLTVFVGQTVEWLNVGQVPHTSTSDTGVWDSGLVNPNGRYSRVFNTVGVFTYKCTLHPGMTGTITVAEATPASTASSTATVSSSATATPTATATATATTAATATASAPAGQGQWVDRPPAASGATPTCPTGGQWLLDYWSGSESAIASAAGACNAADLFWVNRGGKWMGFSKNAPAASDTWNVVNGEAHFVHAP